MFMYVDEDISVHFVDWDSRSNESQQSSNNEHIELLVSGWGVRLSSSYI